MFAQQFYFVESSDAPFKLCRDLASIALLNHVRFAVMMQKQPKLKTGPAERYVDSLLLSDLERLSVRSCVSAIDIVIRIEK
ncbi:hypothetical protein A7X61_08095 [Stenotrophomonas maltophilia]|nr:hypothetical protein A7X61_08095 [Stenotrophomonas maltophilia]